MTTAGQAWREALAAWAIPDEIVAAAPEDPWSLPVSLFAAPETPADTPSRRRALEALGGGGEVIDVGCGGGTASLALVPSVTRVVGVDGSAQMLASFAAAAAACGIAHDEIEGTWPEVAEAGTADVVVCHHVFYNAADLEPFVRALTAAARRRVVVEITAEHPRARTNPLWQRFHGLARPGRPGAEDALAVLREAGIDFEQERFMQPQREQRMSPAERVAFVRRTLCLPAERDAEVEAAMREFDFDAPRELVAIWWDGTG